MCPKGPSHTAFAPKLPLSGHGCPLMSGSAIGNEEGFWLKRRVTCQNGTRP